MRELEAVTPTPAPARDAARLSGTWALLYTGASVDAVEKRRKAEGVVGSAVTELTGASQAPPGEERQKPLGRTITTLSGVVSNTRNFQEIDAFAGVVVNRAELDLLGVAVEVQIKGRCTVATDTRLDVNFERVELSVGRNATRPLVSVPLDWLNGGEGPAGWVETTYLDDELRLGRGDKGSVFVTARTRS